MIAVLPSMVLDLIGVTILLVSIVHQILTDPYKNIMINQSRSMLKSTLSLYGAQQSVRLGCSYWEALSVCAKYLRLKCFLILPAFSSSLMPRFSFHQDQGAPDQYWSAQNIPILIDKNPEH